MSELREELLGGGINKKKIIAIALVAILLVAAFAFSTVLFSFLFGTQRPYPSREKADTDYEDADLIKPPYPFDEDFWQDLLDQVDDPSSLLDMLSEMFDGDLLICQMFCGNMNALMNIPAKDGYQMRGQTFIIFILMVIIFYIIILILSF